MIGARQQLASGLACYATCVRARERIAPRSQRFFPFPRFVMNNSSEPVSTELQIARAYGKLSSMPEDGPKASVPLAKIGNCELRMFRGPETNFDSKALFWLELFDHGTKMSVDSFRCHNIKDATPSFEDLMSQAVSLNNPDVSGAETQ
jgi:hypothetical protein